MGGDYIIEDVNTYLPKEEKIDFESNLQRQIDLIRQLRSQDLGQFVLFNITKDINQKYYSEIYTNIEKYKNAVESFELMLSPYIDEIHETERKQEFRLYEKKIKEIHQQHKTEFQMLPEHKRKDPEIKLYFRKSINTKSKTFAVRHTSKLYDKLYKLCLKLAYRKGFIKNENKVAVSI